MADVMGFSTGCPQFLARRRGADHKSPQGKNRRPHEPEPAGALAPAAAPRPASKSLEEEDNVVTDPVEVSPFKMEFGHVQKGDQDHGVDRREDEFCRKRGRRTD